MPPYRLDLTKSEVISTPEIPRKRSRFVHPHPFTDSPLPGSDYQWVRSISGASHIAASTSILKIGKSDESIRAEILNHFNRHTAANRLARIRRRRDVTIPIVLHALTAVRVI